MREHIEADEPFVREDVPVDAGLERFARRGPGLQGRADRGPGPRRGRRDRLALHERPVHRPLPRARTRPRPSASRRSSSSPSPARTGAARPTTRCSRASTAPRSSSQEDLDEHLERLEEARARDHRKLGARARAVHAQRPLARRAVLAAQRDGAVQRAHAPGARGERARAATTRSRTPILSDVELWRAVRPLGQVPRQHVLRRDRRPPDGPQADELPGPHPDLQRPSAAPTATCRSATPRPASCTATSRRACCTGSCACARSPRTTPTSSAPRSRSRRRSCGCLDLGFRLYEHLRLRAAARALDPARAAPGPRRDLGPRRGRAGQRA